MANSGTYNRTKVHFAEGAAASTPDSGEVVIYAKTDGNMYQKDDAGTETSLAVTGGSGDVATDAIWDAAGDLAVGSGANTASKLTKGSNGTRLAMVSGAVAWQGAVACSLSKSSDQNNIASGSAVKVTFSTADIDTGSMFSDANDRIVVDRTGKWDIRTGVGLKELAGVTDLLISIQVDGTTPYYLYRDVPAGGNLSISGSKLLQLSSSSYVELYVQISGTTGVADVRSGGFTWLDAVFVGS